MPDAGTSGPMCAGCRMMAEESWRYRPPHQIADRLMSEDWYQRREEQGCSACAHRGVFWGLEGCGIGKRPGPRGFCRSYSQDSSYDGDRGPN